MKPMSPRIDIHAVISDYQLRKLLVSLSNAGVPFPVNAELKQQLMNIMYAERHNVMTQVIEDMTTRLRSMLDHPDFQVSIDRAVDHFMQAKGFVPPELPEANDE